MAALLSRMKKRHTYRAVGTCIYCGDSSNSESLTREHIIPKSLGGMLVLPGASCSACQVITSAFEGDNAGKLFRPIRRQFRLPSGKRGRERRAKQANERYRIIVDGKRHLVSSDEWPGLLINFAFPVPTILQGFPPDLQTFAGRVALGKLPEFDERLARLVAKFGSSNIEFPTDADAESTGRLLAKISHAYAIAELGRSAFEPYLLGIIRGHDPSLLHHVVGSALSPNPVSDDLHTIEILPPEALGSGDLVVVAIHLFANYQGMPTHYVVAGKRL